MHEATPLQTMQGDMSSTLPEEIVEEILLRVPANEPANMVRAALVCKAWRHILADDGFLCRYRRFHGTPPLLGLIYNHCRDSIVEFVPTTCIAASTISMPTSDDTNGCIHIVQDCRHGRVLILAKEHPSLVNRRLIVWDPITGDRHQLRVPTCPYSSRYNYAGAVLCVEDACDHLNCHGGSFLVVLVAMCSDNNGIHTWASAYSSEIGAWRAWTHNNDITNHYIDDNRPSLLIGDPLYFPTLFPGYGIVKYDFFKHELSVMELPRKGRPILIKGDNGDLGAAAIMRNCIYMWSWKINIEGVGEWVKYSTMKLEDTLLPNGIEPRNLICMAEGTNTVFIGIEGTGKFMLDLKSKQVRKIGGGESYFYGTILPYMGFYTPKC